MHLSMEVFVWIESPLNNLGRYLSTAIPASVFPSTCRHTEPDGRRSRIPSVSRTFCARPKSDFRPKVYVRRMHGIFSRSLSVCCRTNRSGDIKAMGWRCFARRISFIFSGCPSDSLSWWWKRSREPLSFWSLTFLPFAAPLGQGIRPRRKGDAVAQWRTALVVLGLI